MVRQINHPKPKRFPIGKKIPKRNVLKAKEVERLLRGRVVVEEKMDGRTILFVAENFTVFAEDMRRQHSIHYRVPGRYGVFDVFDAKRGVFLFPDEKEQIALDMRAGKLKVEGESGNVSPILFFPVPRIETGVLTLEELPALIGTSAYALDKETKLSAPMEGIVVKPDRDLFPEEFLTGKIVRSEFSDGIEINYLRLPTELNAIDPSVEVILRLSQGN